MIADAAILQLPKVDLSLRELLPEYSGIYYVIDENNQVWYIGKAKNINKRWQGKSHHRIYQLEARKQQKFTIYYEQVDVSLLDAVEKQRIQKYNPYLNESPVKTKKIRPTETLLRETIIAIADFAFVLGVEPSRKKILICLDLAIFRKIFQPDSLDEERAIRKAVFTNRKTYISKWKGFATKYYCSLKLLVNSYEVNVIYWTDIYPYTKFNNFREWKIISLAQEPIKAITRESLGKFQQLYPNKEYLQRLVPYTSDLIKLFFNEPIDKEAVKKKLAKVSNDYKIGNRGLGSRSQLNSIDELLISREIEPQKYSSGVRPVRGNKMGLYVQCFSINLKKPKLVKWFDKTSRVGISAYGILENEETVASSSQFDTVYLLTGVERQAWLLVEEYLQDFAKPATKLTNGEGYVQKAYISPRKYVTPAKVNIKLEEMKYSVWIPFGFNQKFCTFETAKEEIKRRLQNANLPSLKLAFKNESITK